MVKDSKRRSGVKPGPKVAEDEIKTERLTMRMHTDLMHILNKRAKERNVSRSAYIEQLLIGWVQADPRNPKIDSRGKLVENAPTPLEMMNTKSFQYAEKWAKFNQAYAILIGTDAPKRWVEEPQDYWMGDE
jgi:hypothetical protein